MKEQCPSYERTVSIIWKNSVHHMKEQCPSYERTVSVIWKNGARHMKEQCPSYERTVPVIWKNSVRHMKEQCPSYERTVPIIWKNSVHHVKDYLVALVWIFSWLESKRASNHACPLLPFTCSIPIHILIWFHNFFQLSGLFPCFHPVSFSSCVHHFCTVMFHWWDRSTTDIVWCHS